MGAEAGSSAARTRSEQTELLLLLLPGKAGAGMQVEGKVSSSHDLRDMSCNHHHLLRFRCHDLWWCYARGCLQTPIYVRHNNIIISVVHETTNEFIINNHSSMCDDDDQEVINQ